MVFSPTVAAFIRGPLDAVFFVDKNNFRFVGFGFLRIEVGEARDDDVVPLLGQVGRRAVDLDDAGTLGARDYIGFKAASVGHIPDVDVLMGDQVGGLHQVRVNGDTPLIMQVRHGDRGTVDLGFEHGTKHSGGTLGRECFSVKRRIYQPRF